MARSVRLRLAAVPVGRGGPLRSVADLASAPRPWGQLFAMRSALASGDPLAWRVD